MLNFDRDAIDRIIDRCSPGGSDNRRGIRLETGKAQHQFNAHAAAFLTDSEKEGAEAYFEREIERVKAEDREVAAGE